MKLAVIGPVTKDVIRIKGRKYEQIGGIPFYIGNALASLGNDVTCFITLGKGDIEWACENFKGVKLEFIPKEGTLIFEHSYERNVNNRTTEITFYSNKIIKKDIKDKIEGFDYIIMAPLLYENTPPELFFELRHEKLILGNFGMFTDVIDKKKIHQKPEIIIKILKYVEWLFLDESELKFVSGKNDLDKAIEKISTYVKKIVITRGSKGSIIYSNGRRYLIPAYKPKKIVDPTGAGDTYLAAFIHAIKLFDDYKKIGKFASIAATKSIEKRGPLTLSEEKILKLF